jgi:hypothetical protein
MLGFKLNYLMQTLDIKKVNIELTAREVVPFSLFILIAYLIREEIFKVEDIWQYLILDGKDEVKQYHTSHQKVLAFKYLALE